MDLGSFDSFSTDWVPSVYQAPGTCRVATVNKNCGALFLVLLLTGCVPWGGPLNFTEPHFPSLRMA